MKRLFVLCSVIMMSISCSNAQIKSFSKKSQSQKLTDSEGKEVKFKEVLEKYKGKTVKIRTFEDMKKHFPTLSKIHWNAFKKYKQYKQPGKAIHFS